MDVKHQITYLQGLHVETVVCDFLCLMLFCVCVCVCVFQVETMVYRADTTSSRLFKVLREKIDQVGFLICTSAALSETNPLHLLVDGIVLCNAALQQQQFW